MLGQKEVLILSCHTVETNFMIMILVFPFMLGVYFVSLFFCPVTGLRKFLYIVYSNPAGILSVPCQELQAGIVSIVKEVNAFSDLFL